MPVEKLIVGVDEAGRGPLAGPVAVGVFAYAKHPVFNIKEVFFDERGIRDSKKMTEKKREEVFKKIKELEREGKVKWKVVMIDSKIIDKIGISKSVNLAINRAFSKLNLNPNNTEVRLDGLLKAPNEYKNQKTIIKGDEKESVIALASVCAKVSRDQLMVRLAKKYPKYGLEIHKGYGTKLHREMIKKYGISVIHRSTFCKKLTS